MQAYVTLADLRESLKALTEMGNQAMAFRTLERFIDDIHDQHRWIELRAMLIDLFELEILQQEPWIGLYARVLRGCRDAKSILEISQNSENPLVQVERAWSLIFTQQFKPAYTILETIIPLVNGATLGLAYRLKASVEFEQGKDWKKTWIEVRSQLQRRMLGVAILDEVYQLMQSGDNQRGRASAFEAISLLKRDPYHRAWAQHAIGMSYLRENQIEDAEIALTEAEKLSRNWRAKAFHARALCGIGSLRRLQGDLAMAETHFREATKYAREPDDLSEALWGVGHLLRLQQKPYPALEQFRRALRVSVAAKWIEIHRALAYLMLNEVREARAAIERAGVVVGATQHRLIIARAEIARLEGNVESALEELRTLPIESVTARDESRLFKELFALLGPGQAHRVPQVLVLERRKVEILCLEQMLFYINGRRVELKSASKSTHLFRALLQTDGPISSATLVKQLWPQSVGVVLERKPKQLSQTVRDLRGKLGWRGAVRQFRGAYQLDPETDWLIQSLRETKT
jgi:tetratricopeptide (TPR) repeat protein